MSEPMDASFLGILSPYYADFHQFLERNNLTITNALITLSAVFVVSRIVKYRQGLQTVSHLPGLRVPFWPLGLPGVLIPTCWWNPGAYFTWTWRESLYKRFGHDTISIVPFVGGPAGLYTANLDIARQVVVGGHKTSFIKPESMSRVLLLWGMNLVASDGEVWRRHRRVMGPAFNNDLYRLVWKESLSTYKEMLAGEGWESKKEVEIPILQKFTFKYALLIIGKCGFGFDFNWFSPPKAADGKMSVLESLRVVADTYMIPVFMPKWVLKLPFKRIQESNEAHEQLMHFMKTQVSERKAEIRSQAESVDNRHDAFTMLVKANEEEGKFKLDDQELIGNVFIMLFAGHETTAHTLAATLGFLSVNEDIQEEIYEQVISVVGHDRDPEFDDYSKLDKVLAGFYEALRLFPAGYLLIREAYEDTVLHVPKPVGEEGTTTIPIPKGTQVVIDMIGAQLNPRYFDKPEEFRPSRWYGLATDSEAFSAFSIGPRACIGRKFATVESVCFLSMLLRDFKVQPILRPGETKQQWGNRVLDAKIVITLGMADVPVRFVRRT
ncbi:cytochrome P450 [Gymnopilus junonius]|uniref:Cytochrome P450 n=1 Tax=Gymnopilus junonius TaxID=109634 RepID=A0A9P5NU63_GYMJU|nr:cytochrome P450 [Gymnopilus junonius]